MVACQQQIATLSEYLTGPVSSEWSFGPAAQQRQSRGSLLQIRDPLDRKP
jgi:hypothetical protein